MEFTDEQQRTLRGALNLTDDAELTPAAIASLATRPTAAPAGMTLVADEALDQMQATITRLQTRVDNVQADERHQVMAQALRDGRFTPAQAKHYERMWDADPEGARDLIASLPKNSAVAVSEIGYTGIEEGSAPDSELAEFDALYPPHMRLAAKGK